MRAMLKLVLLLFPTILFGMTSEEFSVWWKNYRNTQNLPIELREMKDYEIDSGLLKYTSQYWNHLNKKNIEQITTHGYENFKQTICQNYFTWVVSLDHPYAHGLKKEIQEISVTLPLEEINRTHPFFGKEESQRFNIVTQHLLNYVLKIGGAEFLKKLEEPMIGNPPFVLYNGKRISQDILNSLLEYIPIRKNCVLGKTPTIIEVGAGSGRTAFCFISLLPNVKYVIVDLSPALYVSQKYLSDVFPSKKVMRFRPFTDFSDIQNDYEKADIVFLTPDQLTKLPDRSADLFLAVDCLHEMTTEVVDHYFSEADRLCSYFYYKCWKNTVVPFDGITYSSDDYAVPRTWVPAFNKTCIIPSDFFHALYQTHPK